MTHHIHDTKPGRLAILLASPNAIPPDEWPDTTVKGDPFDIESYALPAPIRCAILADVEALGIVASYYHEAH